MKGEREQGKEKEETKEKGKREGRRLVPSIARLPRAQEAWSWRTSLDKQRVIDST